MGDHHIDLAGGLGFRGADFSGQARMVFGTESRGGHHLPDAPPPPNDPPPPENPPPEPPPHPPPIGMIHGMALPRRPRERNAKNSQIPRNMRIGMNCLRPSTPAGALSACAARRLKSSASPV